jgi:general nucleoside transport system permease protein
MTALDAPAPTEPSQPPIADPSPGDAGPAEGRSWLGIAERVGRTVLRWSVLVVCTLAVFSAFLVARGAEPLAVLESMWTTSFGTRDAFGETLLRSTPILMAALATAAPARAGLFNLGGQGQLLLGAIGAIVVANWLDGGAGTVVTLVSMGLGGMAFGAAWAAIPAVLKVVTRTNEAISSLLLNYIAALIVTWLCFGPWKDPTSLGQAYSRKLTGPESLPIVWGQRVNIGIVVALLAAVVVWVLLRHTTWGFKLWVLGGNPSAARRAGLAVGGLSIAAMVAGGALAGLGGMLEVAGTEGRLRPELLAGVGFIGFLASWLAKHDPLRAILASVLLGAIAVGGSGLKITAGLSGAAVNILMALVLFAVLGWGTRPEGANDR